jgi:hypothetical protein
MRLVLVAIIVLAFLAWRSPSAPFETALAAQRRREAAARRGVSAGMDAVDRAGAL